MVGLVTPPFAVTKKEEMSKMVFILFT